jgi:hypothetical protein
MKRIKLFEEWQIINEIGEGVSPFPWKRVSHGKVDSWMADMSMHQRGSGSQHNQLPALVYEFKGDKADYTVNIVGTYNEHTYINFSGRRPDAPKPQDYNVFVGVAFDVKKVVKTEPGKEEITNFGEQFKVVSTVAAITEEVMRELQEIEWIKVQEIHIVPKLEDADEGKPITQTKRGRLYLEYIKKQGKRLKGDWTAEVQKDRFVIKAGKWSGGPPDQLIQL